MGAAGSVACTDNVSAEQVGEFVENLGVAYKPYKTLIVENGVNGKLLKSTKASELADLLKDIGITKPLHVRVLMSHLQDITKGSEAPVAAVAHTSAIPFREHDVQVNDSVTVVPRTIMSKLFEIQGIPLDPSDIESTVQKIKGVVGTGYGDGISKYDCFINYRVASDADNAEKLFLYLKTAGVHAFLDKKCLKNGQKWKDGFLSGLKCSNYFVALISKSALAKVRDITQDHTYDNVLLEYETAIKIMQDTNNPKFICPVHVGENNYVPALQQNVLVKFADFNPALYPNSIGACAPPAPDAPKTVIASNPKVAPPKPPAGDDEGAAVGEEEAPAEEEPIACDYDVDVEELAGVTCFNCQDGNICGPKPPINTTWSCDWPNHEGDNEFNGLTDKMYGCSTYLECNWAICETCFRKLQASSTSSKEAMSRVQPCGTKTYCLSTAAYHTNFRSVTIQPFSGTDVDGAWDIIIQFDAHGDGSDGDVEIGSDPVSFQLEIGEYQAFPTSSNVFSKDPYEITGILTYSADHFTKEFLQSNIVSLKWLAAEGEEEFVAAMLAIPGMTVAVPYQAPGCSNEHETVISDFAQGGYAYGFCCNTCRANKHGERWFCQECCDDYCFECEAAPIINPSCANGHLMTSYPEGEIPAKYNGPPLCDVCRKNGLSNNTEYFHCDECSYDLCLCCAYKNMQEVLANTAE